ncbi:MAG: GNAT family N-acetyltransferase [Desulfotalea sp.]
MFEIRPAENNDYDFLFQLRKSALYELVKVVFGWDEEIQKMIHRQEWEDVKPAIIEINGTKIGSYLVVVNSEYLYFGRFYLLPEFQGKGIGSRVLKNVFTRAEQEKLPIKLCYLQGNKVGSWYARHGFRIISEDAEFVHMVKPRNTK